MTDDKLIPDEEQEQLTGPIPEGLIPDSEKYVMGSITTQDAKLMNVGGRLIMSLLIPLMTAEHIVSISGVGNKECIILVDYTVDEIKELLMKARKSVLDKAN